MSRVVKFFFRSRGSFGGWGGGQGLGEFRVYRVGCRVNCFVSVKIKYSAFSPELSAYIMCPSFSVDRIRLNFFFSIDFTDL